MEKLDKSDLLCSLAYIQSCNNCSKIGESAYQSQKTCTTDIKRSKNLQLCILLHLQVNDDKNPTVKA